MVGLKRAMKSKKFFQFFVRGLGRDSGARNKCFTSTEEGTRKWYTLWDLVVVSRFFGGNSDATVYALLLGGVWIRVRMYFNSFGVVCVCVVLMLFFGSSSPKNFSGSPFLARLKNSKILRFLREDKKQKK